MYRRRRIRYLLRIATIFVVAKLHADDTVPTVVCVAAIEMRWHANRFINCTGSDGNATDRSYRGYPSTSLCDDRGHGDTHHPLFMRSVVYRQYNPRRVGGRVKVNLFSKSTGRFVLLLYVLDARGKKEKKTYRPNEFPLAFHTEWTRPTHYRRCGYPRTTAPQRNARYTVNMCGIWYRSYAKSAEVVDLPPFRSFVFGKICIRVSSSNDFKLWPLDFRRTRPIKRIQCSVDYPH